jgi:hypothetical protein
MDQAALVPPGKEIPGNANADDTTDLCPIRPEANCGTLAAHLR